VAGVALEIICPRCESDESLRGRPLDDGLIELTCDACTISWKRDPRPTCPKCGGDDLYHLPQVILEKSRGTQMSVQGIHVEYGCWACDPPEVKVRGGRTHHLPDRLDGSQ
jgi:Zn finger protein HypA/HybF involved in hydrogenase expression